MHYCMAEKVTASLAPMNGSLRLTHLQADCQEIGINSKLYEYETTVL